MPLKATQTTYKYSVDEITNMIAQELKCPMADIEVRFNISMVSQDPWDRDPGTPTVIGVDVIVKG